MAVFVIVWLSKHLHDASDSSNANNQSKIWMMFRVKVLSKYIYWLSTYLWFCMFYELFEASQLHDASLLSYVFV